MREAKADLPSKLFGMLREIAESAGGGMKRIAATAALVVSLAASGCASSPSPYTNLGSKSLSVLEEAVSKNDVRAMSHWLSRLPRHIHVSEREVTAEAHRVVSQHLLHQGLEESRSRGGVLSVDSLNYECRQAMKRNCTPESNRILRGEIEKAKFSEQERREERHYLLSQGEVEIATLEDAILLHNPYLGSDLIAYPDPRGGDGEHYLLAATLIERSENIQHVWGGYDSRWWGRFHGAILISPKYFIDSSGGIVSIVGRYIGNSVTIAPDGREVVVPVFDEAMIFPFDRHAPNLFL